MKAVMLSIRPQWCDLIIRGIKTIEVRKNRPNLETPFKCYIYCTKDKHGWFHFGKKARLDGFVIGEFVCDKISIFRPKSITLEHEFKKRSCLTVQELIDYADTKDEHIYAWSISNLIVYDEPKAVQDFRIPCREYERSDPMCGNCDYYKSMGEYPAECACDGAKPVVRPPQSWCYVEELKHV